MEFMCKQHLTVSAVQTLRLLAFESAAVAYNALDVT